MLAGLALSAVSCRAPHGSQELQRTGFAATVAGQVKTPGIYRFQEGDTVDVAVTKAGGVCKYPGVLTPSEVTVTTNDGSKQRVSWKAWKNLKLRPGDVVTVERKLL